MEIDQTPMFQEASEIMASGRTTANYGWRARLKCGDEELTPLFVQAVNSGRNYLQDLSEVATTTLLFGLGDFARVIYPNRTRLELVLVRVPFEEKGSAVEVEDDLLTQTYSCFLLGSAASPVVAQGSEANDREALNNTQIVDVHLQLLTKPVELLRTVVVGGSHRTTKVEDVVKTLITNGMRSIGKDDAKAMAGIDMVPADNKDVKGHVVITQGTQLVDVPDLIQKRYGVYSSGLGSFIQNKNWYIFPTFNTGLYSTRKRTATALVLPKRKFNGIERTFTNTVDTLSILVTGETMFKDDAGTNFANGGNGVRFADATRLFEETVPGGTHNASFRRGNANSEFRIAEGPNGINLAALSGNRITSNPFAEMSRLAASNGGIVRLTWQHCDIELLFPGMPFKVIYSDSNEIKTVYGVLHSVKYVSHRVSGFGSDRFLNQAVLDVFVNEQVTQIEG